MGSFLNVLKDLTQTSPNRQFVASMRTLKKRYPSGEDSWGLELSFIKRVFIRSWPFYKHYFRVRVFGEENVPETGALMAASNHSGQIALDGGLITMAFFADIKHARILRPMVERFVYKTPFIGAWVAALGGVLGDRRNCKALLRQGEAVLVFPEGLRGIAKSTSQFYKVQRFPTGFYRMALEAGCDILPIAVVGAEEFYPFVYQARGLAKKFGLPCLPITPNIIPLPSPVDIYIGEIHRPPEGLTADSPDQAIQEQVDLIRAKIQSMVSHGLKVRRSFRGERIEGHVESR
jgi:1-acyl-sn-glycerol-3-phosphate acyltransferase